MAARANARVATGYGQRRVEEILSRGAGNCAYHARVLESLLAEARIKTRWVAEINLQSANPDRQRSAEEQIKKRGFVGSIFGLQHNDHRCLEVWDGNDRKWFPADSALGVVGTDAWIKARLGFGARAAAVAEMLVPFVVVAKALDGSVEDRSGFYLIEGFDRALPTWPVWTKQIEQLAVLGRGALQGQTNLHEHNAEMSELADTYLKMKAEALAARLE